MSEYSEIEELRIDYERLRSAKIRALFATEYDTLGELRKAHDAAWEDRRKLVDEINDLTDKVRKEHEEATYWVMVAQGANHDHTCRNHFTSDRQNDPAAWLCLRCQLEQRDELLLRISAWDHMDTAGDGAFWRGEISKVTGRPIGWKV